MRQARIRGEGLSYYHCLSRVVDRQFILGDEEREHFVALMRKLEAFLGLRVVTYAVMSNLLPRGQISSLFRLKAGDGL